LPLPPRMQTSCSPLLSVPVRSDQLVMSSPSRDTAARESPVVGHCRRLRPASRQGGL
jgi:hypothetical protein